jgi:hypothetical protein
MSSRQRDLRRVNKASAKMFSYQEQVTKRLLKEVGKMVEL